MRPQVGTWLTTRQGPQAPAADSRDPTVVTSALPNKTGPHTRSRAAPLIYCLERRLITVTSLGLNSSRGNVTGKEDQQTNLMKSSFHSPCAFSYTRDPRGFQMPPEACKRESRSTQRRVLRKAPLLPYPARRRGGPAPGESRSGCAGCALPSAPRGLPAAAHRTCPAHGRRKALHPGRHLRSASPEALTFSHRPLPHSLSFEGCARGCRTRLGPLPPS